MIETDSPSRPLFTFAIVADSHVNPTDDASSSPWTTNRLANPRTRRVVREIEACAPDFVVHLGDLVHPVPALPAYAPAAERFHELFAPLAGRLHLVPGNHDVGDKPLGWMPAGIVNDDHLALYERYFGKDFYAFDHKGCHFVILNAQVLNSGLGREAEQRVWLEADLEASAGRRIFLFLHYPPYVVDPGESGHYDNIDEPARSWLLGLLVRYRVEALFAGHVHNFFYNRHGETECYVLPSVAFVRHDYSEMFRVEAADDHGRDDRPKLGWFLVEVYADGHVAHVMRSYGETGEGRPAGAGGPPRVHTKRTPAPVGVDLRHPWAERLEIPYSGGVDEFERKPARSDYALLALWEMGIGRLRVPLHDLADEQTRARMRALAAVGHEFTVFTYGVPSGLARDALVAHAGLVRAWEVILRWDEVEASLAGIAALKRDGRMAVYLSRLRTSADAAQQGARFSHFVRHGFFAEDRMALEALGRLAGAREAVDGVVFRVPRGGAPWVEIGTAQRLAASLGLRASVQVCLAGDDPAVACADDLANANRVAETLGAAFGAPDVRVFLDTFVDLDRGYFPRHGLIDRRHNPRLAGRVFRNLHAALQPEAGRLTPGDLVSLGSGRLCHLRGRNRRFVLILPERRLSAREVAASLGWPAALADLVDLATGEVAAGVELDAPVRAWTAPALLVLRA